MLVWLCINCVVSKGKVSVAVRVTEYYSVNFPIEIIFYIIRKYFSLATRDKNLVTLSLSDMLSINIVHFDFKV